MTQKIFDISLFKKIDISCFMAVIFCYTFSKPQRKEIVNKMQNIIAFKLTISFHLHLNRKACSLIRTRYCVLDIDIAIPWLTWHIPRWCCRHSKIWVMLSQAAKGFKSLPLKHTAPVIKCIKDENVHKIYFCGLA